METPPDPHPHADGIAGDLDAIATRLSATITLLEEAARDVQASILMAQASALRLRQ